MLLLIFALASLANASSVASCNRKVVFPVANETLVWALQALNPILLLNGYSNESKFRQQQIFGPTFSFLTIRDLVNIGMNRITLDTLLHCLRVICLSFAFALEVHRLPKQPQPPIPASWTVWVEVEGTSRITQIALLNGKLYYAINFSSSTKLPGKQVDIPEFIGRQTSQLHQHASKSLCLIMMLVEELGESLKLRPEHEQTLSLEPKRAGWLTSVSYYRAMLGFLVLLVEPANAVRLFHSLRVRGERLRGSLDTVALFLSEYYYVASTNQHGFFQPEQFNVITVAKQMVQHLLPHEYPAIFAIKLGENEQTLKIQSQLAALIQALLAADQFGAAIIENPDAPAHNPMAYEQFLVLMKFWKQKGGSYANPFYLQAMQRALKIDHECQQLGTVHLITRILAALTVEVAQKFSLKFQSVSSCPICRQSRLHSHQSTFYFAIEGGAERGKQVTLSSLIQQSLSPQKTEAVG